MQMVNHFRSAGLAAALLMLAAVVCGPAAAEPDPADLVKASLMLENSSVQPGASVWAAVHFTIAPGWHIYWRTPGDSGLATSIAWSLPPGLTAGTIAWPPPQVIMAGGLVNYGYEHETTLLVPLSVAATAQPGTHLPLTADVSWLVCAQECIPGNTTLTAGLGVGEMLATDAGSATLFAATRAQVPKKAPFASTFAAGAGNITLSIPRSAVRGLQAHAYFLPYDNAQLDYSAAQKQWMDDSGLHVTLKLSQEAAKPVSHVDGVLVLSDGAGTNTFEITPVAGAMFPSPQQTPGTSWLHALVLAFLGGIILNIMPCVFPILSLKILALTSQARKSHAHIRLHGLAYTSGVLLSFAVLAGVLLALRAGGEQIGWGFQLQSPLFVTALAYVIFAMALSLSGALLIGGRLMGVGGGLIAGEGLRGSFFTGLLATIVATPCSAPFMGVAVGAALTAPVPQALGIFAMLGLGLAFPYLLLCFLPHLSAILPRPGAWMEVMKQALAFPLYATVAWLLWVLSMQADPGALLIAAFGLVLIGFAAWAQGQGLRARSGKGRRLALASLWTALTMVAGLTFAPALLPASGNDGLAYEAFSQEKLDMLLTGHKPVFINLTAAWCITCKLNERTALSSDSVRSAFNARGITALKGDWTNRNPEITALLQRYGRGGVPLYLYYNGKADAAPVIFPQILTETTLLSKLENASS